MITLKRGQWVTLDVAEEQQVPSGVLFDLPPLGAPGIRSGDEAALTRLAMKIAELMGSVYQVVCQPQRIGHRSSMAVHLKNDQGARVDILITVTGRTRFPQEEGCRGPRWYLDVADAADALYLVLWLGRDRS